MGIKMGRYNRITAERFHVIKAALAEGMSDSAVMAKYEIKKTTLRYIQKSASFYEYRLFTEMLPAARKMPKVIAPSSGLEFEDISYKKKKVAKNPAATHKTQSRKRNNAIKIRIVVGVAGLIIIGLILVTANLIQM